MVGALNFKLWRAQAAVQAAWLPDSLPSSPPASTPQTCVPSAYLPPPVEQVAPTLQAMLVLLRRFPVRACERLWFCPFEPCVCTRILLCRVLTALLLCNLQSISKENWALMEGNSNIKEKRDRFNFLANSQRSEISGLRKEGEVFEVTDQNKLLLWLVWHLCSACQDRSASS